MKTIYFIDYKISESGSRSHKSKDWKKYWDSLNESQKESLRQKAQWEHMTLSAVATEYGAKEPDLQNK